VNARVRCALALFAAAAVLAAGCDDDDGAVRVFAASSLQDVLPAAVAGHRTGAGAPRLVFQYGGSQTLATQILEGAPADLFLSANEAQAERLRASGRVARSATLLENRLAVAVREGSTASRIDDLARPGVRIAVGAPEVPVGALTRQLFDALAPEVARGLRANVVTEDPSVRVVLSRVELGEADAAFVYQTDLAAARRARALPLPPAVAGLANRYVLVELRDASPGAAALFDYLLGAEAQRAFAAAGFVPAAQAGAVPR